MLPCYRWSTSEGRGRLHSLYLSWDSILMWRRGRSTWAFSLPEASHVNGMSNQHFLSKLSFFFYMCSKIMESFYHSATASSVYFIVILQSLQRSVTDWFNFTALSFIPHVETIYITTSASVTKEFPKYGIKYLLLLNSPLLNAFKWTRDYSNLSS